MAQTATTSRPGTRGGGLPHALKSGETEEKWAAVAALEARLPDAGAFADLVQLHRSLARHARIRHDLAGEAEQLRRLLCLALIDDVAVAHGMSGEARAAWVRDLRDGGKLYAVQYDGEVF